MGYRTRYNLDTQPQIESVPELPDAVAALDGGFTIRRDGNCVEEASWYEHEEDMEALSAQFPDVTFVLTGEGEENDDQWEKYFKYGKLQASVRAEIIFPEVDTTKFKP